ncbi:transposase [Micromonospora sp. NPDC047187]|uniref:RNA-guided endonuclease InsQ/TnpB family protein n=1 Tax=Micromonospora sp. NPDC047187 TaxID=3155262 RepID=UPI0034098AAC
MQLRYQFRVYPTPGQQMELVRTFGCARVVFNDGLRARQEAREAGLPYVSDGELSKRVITEAKKTVARAWLGEVSAVVLQQALADLNTAYRNFFASVTGKRKGRKVAPPRFRSRKDNRQSIRFTKNSRFKVLDNGRLRLPKVGDLAVRWSRTLPSDPSSVAIIRDAAGRYFASFVVTVDAHETLPPVDAEVGIDLGLTHFAVLSDGTKVAAPKFLRRAARKLKRLQQDLSRKQKDSNRRKTAVVKVARAHARVALLGLVGLPRSDQLPDQGRRAARDHHEHGPPAGRLSAPGLAGRTGQPRNSWTRTSTASSAGPRDP